MKNILKLLFFLLIYPSISYSDEINLLKKYKFSKSNILSTNSKFKIDDGFSKMASNDMPFERNPYYNRNAGLATFGEIFFRDNPDNVYKNSVNSVVILDSFIRDKKTKKFKYTGTGAGVIIKPKRGHVKEGNSYTYFVLTNWHVIDGAQGVRICFKPAGRKVTTDCKDTGGADAKLLNYSIEKDLALLFFHSQKKFEGIEFEKYDNISVGQQVHAIGHPKSLLWSYSKGTISQIREEYDWEIKGYKHFSTVIQMQTPISSGNSGGPLLNDQGKLVGINTWVNSSGQNLNFAISINSIGDFFYQVFNADEKKGFNVDQFKQDAEGYIRKLLRCVKKNNCVAHDDNKDGIADAYSFDYDGNNKVDHVLMDINQDGVVELMAIDKNENGSYEKIIVDKNGDGAPDLIHYDTDDDDILDVTWYDSNKDGELDSFAPYEKS